MPSVNLAYVYEPYPDELTELRSAIEALTGEPPARALPIAGYAGPNEVVQLIIDQASWTMVLKALALRFGWSFADAIGKQAADDIWKNKACYAKALMRGAAEPVRRLIAAILELRDKRQTVAVGVHVPDTPRNATLNINSTDPAEIAWQIANVARCAVEIRNIILDAQANDSNFTGEGPNEDLSIPIQILPSGDIRVLGKTIKK